MGKLTDMNRSLAQMNTAQANQRGREAELRKEIIREMVYSIRANQPMPAPFPTKEEVKKTKGFSNRVKASQRRAFAKKATDLQRLYDDFQSGAIDKENALAYLEAQL